MSADAFVLLLHYLRGEAQLDDVVRALRALPPLPPGDVWFGIDDRELETDEAKARLAALGRALADTSDGEVPGQA